MYKKILVPLDGSELAKKALEYAEELAKTYSADSAEIILFQVVPLMPIFVDPELVKPVIDEEKEKEAAQRYLTELAEEMKTRGHKVTVTVRTGRQVAVEIIDLAKERGVDLIVMCTHGHWGFTRWVLGSVVHKVLIRAETPILLIHLKR